MTHDEMMLARFVAERPVWGEMYAEGPEAWKAIEGSMEYGFWRFGAECGELWRALLEGVAENRIIVLGLIVSGWMIALSYILA